MGNPVTGGVLCVSCEVLPGAHLNDAIKQAKELCKQLHLGFIRIRFNGVDLCISKNSSSERLYREYRDKLREVEL